MATRGSRPRPRRAPELGHLEPGAAADLDVYDLSGVADAGVADPVAGLLWASPGRRPRDVAVAGRVVVRDGALTAADEHALAAGLRSLLATRRGAAGRRRAPRGRHRRRRPQRPDVRGLPRARGRGHLRPGGARQLSAGAPRPSRSSAARGSTSATATTRWCAETGVIEDLDLPAARAAVRRPRPRAARAAVGGGEGAVAAVHRGRADARVAGAHAPGPGRRLPPLRRRPPPRRAVGDGDDRAARRRRAGSRRGWSGARGRWLAGVVEAGSRRSAADVLKDYFTFDALLGPVSTTGPAVWGLPPRPPGTASARWATRCATSPRSGGRSAARAR